MGQLLSRAPESFGDRFRVAVYAKERELVAQLMAHPEFNPSLLPREVFVELIQRQWDRNTIESVCRGAKAEDISLLLSTAVISGATLSYHALFTFLSDALAKRRGGQALSLAEFCKEHKLRELFIVVCHKNNDEMLDAFLENNCFLPDDVRPLRYFVQREIVKNTTASDRSIRAVLKSHCGQISAANELLEACKSTASFEHSKKMVCSALEDYASQGH